MLVFGEIQSIVEGLPLEFGYPLELSVQVFASNSVGVLGHDVDEASGVFLDRSKRLWRGIVGHDGAFVVGHGCIPHRRGFGSDHGASGCERIAYILSHCAHAYVGKMGVTLACARKF
jgi:hypothetical protein